jgi:hypothetical protein
LEGKISREVKEGREDNNKIMEDERTESEIQITFDNYVEQILGNDHVKEAEFGFEHKFEVVPFRPIESFKGEITLTDEGERILRELSMPIENIHITITYEEKSIRKILKQRLQRLLSKVIFRK